VTAKDPIWVAAGDSELEESAGPDVVSSSPLPIERIAEPKTKTTSPVTIYVRTVPIREDIFGFGLSAFLIEFRLDFDFDVGTAVDFLTTAVPHLEQNSEFLSKPIPHFEQNMMFWGSNLATQLLFCSFSWLPY
jgi:hypothetical protein